MNSYNNLNENSVCIPQDTENKKIDLFFQKKSKRTTTKPVVALVESNEELRSDLTNNLSDTYVVISFTDGLEALSFLKTVCVDLVICGTDVQGMSSEELSSKIKTLNNTNIIPVILISSPTGSDYLNKRIASMADIFVHLPFSMEHLKAEMAVLITNHRRLRRTLLAKIFGEEFLNMEPPMIEGYTYEDFIEKVTDIVLQNLEVEKHVTIEEIAREMNMCRTKFSTIWGTITGESPWGFTCQIQQEKAKELLMSGKYRVGDIPTMIGMKDYKNFRERFKKHIGMTPQQAIALGKAKLL